MGILRAAFAMALASGLLCGAVPVWMQDAASVGIQIGTKAPAFELADQSGRKRTLASLMERRGLVLIFFRSADW